METQIQSEAQTTVETLTTAISETTAEVPQPTGGLDPLTWLLNALLAGAGNIKDAIVDMFTGGFSIKELLIVLAAILAIAGVIYALRWYTRRQINRPSENSGNTENNNSQSSANAGTDNTGRNSSYNHSSGSSQSQHNTVLFGAKRLYIDKIDIKPVYTVVSGKERLSKVIADITVINEHSSTEKIIFEACIFVSSSFNGKKQAIFTETTVRSFLPMTPDSFTIEYLTNFNLVPENTNFNQKCILQISSNRKVILRKDIQLWK